MSEIDEIKARLDVVDVVQSYTPLQKAGRNFKGLCPFHNEKTPSFVVFPETQTWRCFGACSEGGDIFGFVMKAEGWDFGEALRVLADRAGVELKPRSPQAQEAQANTEHLLGLLNEAADFYMNRLFDAPDGKIARDYVTQRGLKEETVENFQIGYSPDGWQIVLDHFTQLGYSTEDLIEAGLVIKNDKGRVYDRFRHRLMIPIHDGRGRVVGFGARGFTDEQVPKYLNSPQGPLFDKSRLLYGMDKARRAIRENETVVVVEGYMDVIQAHQAGYTNVVAQMGTALTNTQAQLLAKYANRLVLALDSDNAGVRATMRGLNVVHESLSENGQDQVNFDAHGMINMSGKLKLDTRILNLPFGKDPDDFIRSDPRGWEEAINKATPLADYVIDIGTRSITHENDIYERERVARELVPLLLATESDLQRQQNIQRLALRLHIPERELLRISSQQKKTRRRPPKQSQPKRDFNPRNQQEPPPRQYDQYGGSLQTEPPPSNSRQKPTEQSKVGGQSGSRALELERYCLSILLREPLWVFAADRKLRQLALLAEDDEIAVRILQAFGVKDFTRSDHQVLLELIQRSSEQDKIEPQEFIKEHLSPELEDLVDSVLPEPLENFHNKTNDMHRKALKNVLKQSRRFEERPLEPNEFLRTVLEIRLSRIEREMSELYFLEEDARLTNNEGDGVDPLLIRGLSKAKTLIQRSLRDLR